MTSAPTRHHCIWFRRSGWLCTCFLPSGAKVRQARTSSLKAVNKFYMFSASFLPCVCSRAGQYVCTCTHVWPEVSSDAFFSLFLPYPFEAGSSTEPREFTSLVRLVSQQAQGFLGLSALGLHVSITMPSFLPGF